MRLNILSSKPSKMKLTKNEICDHLFSGSIDRHQFVTKLEQLTTAERAMKIVFMLIAIASNLSNEVGNVMIVLLERSAYILVSMHAKTNINASFDTNICYFCYLRRNIY